MEQNSNYIIVEMNLKFQMKDYRLVLGMRKAWTLFLITLGIKIIEMVIHKWPAEIYNYQSTVQAIVKSYEYQKPVLI